MIHISTAFKKNKFEIFIFKKDFHIICLEDSLKLK